MKRIRLDDQDPKVRQRVYEWISGEYRTSADTIRCELLGIVTEARERGGEFIIIGDLV